MNTMLTDWKLFCNVFVAIFYRAIWWYYETHVFHGFNSSADNFCTARVWPQRSKEEERLISIAGLVKQFLLSIEYYCSKKVNIWSCTVVTSKCLCVCLYVRVLWPSGLVIRTGFYFEILSRAANIHTHFMLYQQLNFCHTMAKERGGERGRETPTGPQTACKHKLWLQH